MAQLRERMAELDRAVTAVTNAGELKQKRLDIIFFNSWCVVASVSSSSRDGPQPEEEPEGAKYVDANSFEVLQGLLNQLQQEHERLMGTVAHQSQELEIDKEHIKVRVCVCTSVCCLYMDVLL